MSFRSPDRARRRRHGLATAGALISALLVGVPTAVAVDTSSASTGSQPPVRADKAPLADLTGGRYVVVLRAPSASGYAAANPTGGEGFNARSARAQNYIDRLHTTQQSLAREVGARIDQSFTIATNGFSAHLTSQQAFQLSSDRRVLLLQKDTLVHSDGINTADFLGMTGKNGAWSQGGGRSQAGAGIVVADLDSGIWPESKSFAGSKLTSTPKTKWDISRNGTSTRMEKATGGVFRGKCQLGDAWKASDCNTKLIGARYYSDGYLGSGGKLLDVDYLSTRDGNGHGSHTASTAAGNVVRHVSTEGVKFGTISGMAPAARIAAYKVLWAQDDGTASGATSDIVAAIDDAVADGADVINFSISGAEDTVVDATEIAFEGAAEAGVFVSTSAGNSGPTASTVAHNSPWLTTVAATTYHNFENTLVLGDGTKIVGASVNDKPVPSSPLINSTDAVVAGGDADDATLCGPDTLAHSKVAGKIVVCTRGVYDRVAKSAEVARAGGIGMVLANPSENSLDADFHSVPTVHIDDHAAKKVFRYLDKKGAAATASIAVGNITSHVTPLPQVAGFSSRGPALANDSDILKPDISAPGVSVLAAVSPPTNSGRDYDLYSGTSMAAPHITGLAAFMLGAHPSWTPMEIKSAMMTTSDRVRDADGTPSKDWFAEGSGQVVPKRFFKPGLFVLSFRKQWRGFLTGQGLDTGVPAVEAKDVNTPSLAEGQLTASQTFHRTFTSQMKGVWKITANVPGFRSVVSEKTLVAKRKGDIETVDFTFKRTTARLGKWAKGSVVLSGPTEVRIPIVLRPVSVSAPATVHGTGTSGSVEVPITSGFTGDLNVDATGFDKAQSNSGSVAPGKFKLVCVPVAANSKIARFDLDAADDTADLDMFVYHSTSCSPDDIDAQVGESATGSADELVTLTNPPAGSYLVEIDGFSAGDAGSPMAYQLRSYDITPSSTAGHLTVSPNPVPVVARKSRTFDVSWSGLAGGSSYLGLLEYEGAVGPTIVEVTTP